MLAALQVVPAMPISLVSALLVLCSIMTGACALAAEGVQDHTVDKRVESAVGCLLERRQKVLLKVGGDVENVPRSAMEHKCDTVSVVCAGAASLTCNEAAMQHL